MSLSERLRSRRMIAVFLALGVLGLAAAVVLSPVFALRTVEVSGNSVLSKEDVVEAAGVELGENVIFLSTEQIASRLASDPWVAGATAVKSMPSTVRIEIRERRAAAVVRAPDAFLLVAGDGSILASTRLPQRLPLIPGIRGGSIGGSLPSDVLPAAAVAGSLGAETLAQVSSVGVAPGGAIRLRLSTGTKVLYGPPVEVNEKAQALDALLRWDSEHSPEKLRTLDIRAPSAPSARVVGDSRRSLELDGI
ncbi:MAG: FtsQ-type POTRA domain-containing protein [Actinomycetota bacterium]